MAKRKTTPYPPMHLLNAINDKYPDVWSTLDDMRNMNHTDGLDWPEWCYLPMSATMSGIGRWTYEDAQILSALYPWRISKEAFSFDSSLTEMLFAQSDDTKIPTDVILSLPFYSIYCEVPNLTFRSTPFHGFFAFLEYDLNNQEKELRFLLIDKKGEQTCPLSLHLGHATFKEAFDTYMDVSVQRYQKQFHHKMSRTEHDELMNYQLENMTLIKKLLQLVLYLCAANKDVSENPEQSKVTRRTNTVKDKYTEIRKWDVGMRIGPKVSRALKENDPEPKTVSVTHSSHHSPRPHIRAGHWHHFWQGPRESDQRKLVLHWLAPILVNGDDLDELPVTVHRVM